MPSRARQLALARDAGARRDATVDHQAAQPVGQRVGRLARAAPAAAEQVVQGGGGDALRSWGHDARKWPYASRATCRDNGPVPRRLVQLFAGLVLYGVSCAMIILATLGNEPWDVLHQGLARADSASGTGHWTVIVSGDRAAAVDPAAAAAGVRDGGQRDRRRRW